MSAMKDRLIQAAALLDMDPDDLLTKLDPPTRTVCAATITSEDLTRMHLAVEDVLIEYRDSGIGMLGPRNGFVVNYRDGTPSDTIRLGTRDGLRIALAALFDVKSTELPR